MSIKDKFLSATTWWHGQTLSTRLFTARHGTKVGEDDQGNIFYRNSDDSRRSMVETVLAFTPRSAAPEAQAVM